VADKIGRAVLEISIDSKQYKFALDEIEKGSKDTADHVRGISQAVNLAVWKELGTIALGALKGIVGTIVDLGTRGAAVTDLSTSFGVLAAKTGETADAMLGSLREGVKGTLSDFDLMMVGNKVLGSGLIKTSDDMGTLAAGARLMAKATGGTTVEAMDKLTTAMASGRTAALKQLGLFVDSKVAVENYAAAHHKSVSDLTDADRAAALAAASLAALRQKLKDIPPDAADFGEQIDQAKATLTNLNDQVAVGVSQSPVLAAGMQAMGQALSTAFGGKQTNAVNLVVHAIEDVAIWVAKAAQVAVDGAGFMSDAFYGARFVLNALLEAVSKGVAAIAGQLAKLFEFMAPTPVIGAAYAKIGASLRTVEDGAKAAAIGFGELKDQSVQDSNAAATATGLVSAAIGKVVTAMEEAKKKTGDAAATTSTAIKGIGDAGDQVVPRSKEATDKIAAAYAKLQQDVVLGTKEGLDKRLAEIEIAKENELAKVRELTGGVGTEYEKMRLLVEEKYAQQTAAAVAHGDTVTARMAQLQTDILQLQMTGDQLKLAQIETTRLKEIEGLNELALTNKAKYDEMVLLIQQKYGLITGAAIDSANQQIASSIGVKDNAIQRAQEILDNALNNQKLILDNKKSTDAQIAVANGLVAAAEKKVDDEKTAVKIKNFELIASAASGILRSLFGKSKAAAIAAVIIDTAAAVISSFRNAGGYPWGLIPAAAMAAAGIAQINKIRSTDAGFAEGTPGLDFTGFGRSFPTVLHGNEAVIPQGRGHLLAGEIAAAMPGAGEDGSGALLARIAAGVESLPAEMRRVWRTAAMQAAR
jgi:hypothetical protein